MQNLPNWVTAVKHNLQRLENGEGDTGGFLLFLWETINEHLADFAQDPQDVLDRMLAIIAPVANSLDYGVTLTESANREFSADDFNNAHYAIDSDVHKLANIICTGFEVLQWNLPNPY